MTEDQILQAIFDYYLTRDRKKLSEVLGVHPQAIPHRILSILRRGVIAGKVKLNQP